MGNSCETWGLIPHSTPFTLLSWDMSIRFIFENAIWHRMAEGTLAFVVVAFTRGGS